MRAIADMADIHYVRQGEPLGLGHAVSHGPRTTWATSPSWCCSATTSCTSGPGVLAGMLAAYERHGAPSWPSRRSPRAEISSYGCVAAEPVEDDSLVRVLDIVEKPTPEEAPSNLASWAATSSPRPSSTPSARPSPAGAARSS